MTDWLDVDWEQAACRDVDKSVFFPKTNATVQATKYCEECPIQKDCRDYALEHEEFGIWGNMSARQRRIYVRLA